SPEYSSSAWPSPATFPWPKMPSIPGTSRRRSPSLTLYCLPRYSTTAWAAVTRTVPMVSLPDRGMRGSAVQHDRLPFGHLGDRRPGAFLADAAALEAAVGHQVRAPQGR